MSSQSQWSDVSVSIDDLLPNPVERYTGDLTEEPTRELTSLEHFYVNVADVFLHQAQEKARERESAATTTSTTTKHTKHINSNVAWPFANIEQKLNMARFQLDNLIGLLDQILLPPGNQPSRQLQVVERDPGLMAEQAAQAATSAAHSDDPTLAASVTALSSYTHPHTADMSTIHPHLKKQRYGTLIIAKQQQLESVANMLEDARKRLEIQVERQKRYHSDLYQLHHRLGRLTQRTHPRERPPGHVVIDYGLGSIGAGLDPASTPILRADTGHIYVAEGVGRTDIDDDIDDQQTSETGWLHVSRCIYTAQRMLLYKQLHAMLTRDARDTHFHHKLGIIVHIDHHRIRIDISGFNTIVIEWPHGPAESPIIRGLSQSSSDAIVLMCLHKMIQWERQNNATQRPPLLKMAVEPPQSMYGDVLTGEAEDWREPSPSPLHDILISIHHRYLCDRIRSLLMTYTQRCSHLRITHTYSYRMGKWGFRVECAYRLIVEGTVRGIQLDIITPSPPPLEKLPDHPTLPKNSSICSYHPTLSHDDTSPHPFAMSHIPLSSLQTVNHMTCVNLQQLDTRLQLLLQTVTQ